MEVTDELNAIQVEAQWIQRLNPAINKARLIPTFEFRVSPIITLADLEVQYIAWALDAFEGNKLATCKALGIGRQTLYNKLESAGIQLEPDPTGPKPLGD